MAERMRPLKAGWQRPRRRATVPSDKILPFVHRHWSGFGDGCTDEMGLAGSARAAPAREPAWFNWVACAPRVPNGGALLVAHEVLNANISPVSLAFYILHARTRIRKVHNWNILEVSCLRESWDSRTSARSELSLTNVHSGVLSHLLQTSFWRHIAFNAQRRMHRQFDFARRTYGVPHGHTLTWMGGHGFGFPGSHLQWTRLEQFRDTLTDRGRFHPLRLARRRKASSLTSIRGAPPP
ncbi:hypothetical protein BDN70DRAFT_897283 [Pholiota conissans]|uniref:Uncharacterized protein n=1 Tax=Pholiota conissans TaxID=109636 RepID=A0A9P5YVJ2_9AGAR|nr:hypothetical protein BDN70DRAFT_897283 [Pholiota conissans]